MKYEKPNIALVASAVEAVKGDQTKHADPTIDCPCSLPRSLSIR